MFSSLYLGAAPRPAGEAKRVMQIAWLIVDVLQLQLLGAGPILVLDLVLVGAFLRLRGGAGAFSDPDAIIGLLFEGEAKTSLIVQIVFDLPIKVARCEDHRTTVPYTLRKFPPQQEIDALVPIASCNNLHQKRRLQRRFAGA
jgi:hypothetical protein